MAPTFSVVQPSVVTASRHNTAAEAFAEIERAAERTAHTGAKSDAVALVVVDEHDQIVERPKAHFGSQGTILRRSKGANYRSVT